MDNIYSLDENRNRKAQILFKNEKEKRTISNDKRDISKENFASKLTNNTTNNENLNSIINNINNNKKAEKESSIPNCNNKKKSKKRKNRQS